VVLVCRRHRAAPRICVPPAHARAGTMRRALHLFTRCLLPTLLPRQRLNSIAARRHGLSSRVIWIFWNLPPRATNAPLRWTNGRVLPRAAARHSGASSYRGSFNARAAGWRAPRKQRAPQNACRAAASIYIAALPGRAIARQRRYRPLRLA
jgi:hypothetical protein